MSDEAAELAAAFKADFRALADDPQPVHLELSKVNAWILAAQLQLALRHPKNTGPTALIGRQIVQRIHVAVATTPALAAVAAKGWDPAQDQAPTDEQWAAQTLAHVLDHLRVHASAGCASCIAWIRGHGGTVERPLSTPEGPGRGGPKTP